MNLDDLRHRIQSVSNDDLEVLRDWFYALPYPDKVSPAIPAEACCEQLSLQLEDGEIAMHYLPHLQAFALGAIDGGPSLVEIEYCPWCGSRLPGLRALSARGRAP